MAWIERCKTCSRPFSIQKLESQASAADQQAEIDCPHCRDVWEARRSGEFTTAALTPEEEEAFHRGDLRSDGECRSAAR